MVNITRPEEHDVTDSTPVHLQPLDDQSGRGFTHLPPMPSVYGGTTRVYESSAASAPHIWLATECPANLNEPDGPTIEAVSHLTVENALLLADQIVNLVASHYQLEREDVQTFLEAETRIRLAEDNDE